MKPTYFFYDLETTGLDTKSEQIMQFAGIRTDENFNIIGEPVNEMVEVSDDMIPDPFAILTTLKTPQETREIGYTESQFAKILDEEIFTPNTTIIGFNNINYDDEIIRHFMWRNFKDPYAWHYKDGKSRFDVYNLILATYALRPEGINFPVIEDKVSLRLENLSKANGILHDNAHDALSDVKATIGIFKLVKEKQSKLVDYLFRMRDKRKILELIGLDNKEGFLLVDRYVADKSKTAVVLSIAPAKHQKVIVWDLKKDPSKYLDKATDELKKLYFSESKSLDEDEERLPIFQVNPSKMPIISPLSILKDEKIKERLDVDLEIVAKNRKTLLERPDFLEKVRSIFEDNEDFSVDLSFPETSLYCGFLTDEDTITCRAISAMGEKELSDFHPIFHDDRLGNLLVHYKARNFPKSLTTNEKKSWDDFKNKRLEFLLKRYETSMKQIESKKELNKDQEFALKELYYWVQRVIEN